MRGFSLIETIVGIALMVIVFVGIAGMTQMGIKLAGQAGTKITATALANQKIELTRNLSYDNVGTTGGIPNGTIPENETIIRNGISFTVKTTVVYIDDPFDGLGANDPLPTDYKSIKVLVSWPGMIGSPVSLQTYIAPKGIETTSGGGTISVLVFDGNGQPVSQADVHIEDASSTPAIDVHYQTDNDGRLYLPGAPAGSDCYKITATKDGYSTDRTYAVGEKVRGISLAVPNKPFLSVLQGQMSEISFAIDKLSVENIQTIKYTEEKNQSGSFDDQNLVSDPITPSGLVSWKQLSWTSTSTTIDFQLLSATSSDWVLIPGYDFTASPADISQLDSFQYPSVEIKSNEASGWQISWLSTDTTAAVPNISFTIQGTKTLGLDSGGNPVYKYQNTFTTDSSGQITISNLEWDSYKITINGAATGYDIANSLPVQPVTINPDVNQNVVLKMTLHQSNSLLTTVTDAAGNPLLGAAVHLYGTGYDKTQATIISSQSFFSPLDAGTYNLDVQMSGFQDWSGQVDVSGQSEKIIILTPP